MSLGSLYVSAGNPEALLCITEPNISKLRHDGFSARLNAKGIGTVSGSVDLTHTTHVMRQVY